MGQEGGQQEERKTKQTVRIPGTNRGCRERTSTFVHISAGAKRKAKKLTVKTVGIKSSHKRASGCVLWNVDGQKLETPSEHSRTVEGAAEMPEANQLQQHNVCR